MRPGRNRGKSSVAAEGGRVMHLCRCGISELMLLQRFDRKTGQSFSVLGIGFIADPCGVSESNRLHSAPSEKIDDYAIGSSDSVGKLASIPLQARHCLKKRRCSSRYQAVESLRPAMARADQVIQANKAGAGRAGVFQHPSAGANRVCGPAKLVLDAGTRSRHTAFHRGPLAVLNIPFPVSMVCMPDT